MNNIRECLEEVRIKQKQVKSKRNQIDKNEYLLETFDFVFEPGFRREDVIKNNN